MLKQIIPAAGLALLIIAPRPASAQTYYGQPNYYNQGYQVNSNRGYLNQSYQADNNGNYHPVNWGRLESLLQSINNQAGQISDGLFHLSHNDQYHFDQVHRLQNLIQNLQDATRRLEYKIHTQNGRVRADDVQGVVDDGNRFVSAAGQSRLPYHLQYQVHILQQDLSQLRRDSGRLW